MHKKIKGKIDEKVHEKKSELKHKRTASKSKKKKEKDKKKDGDKEKEREPKLSLSKDKESKDKKKDNGRLSPKPPPHSLSAKRASGGSPRSDWDALIKWEEIVLSDEIAKGSYGTVWRGKCRGIGVAIKVLHNQHLNTQKLEELKQEVDIMRRLRHPSLLLFMGVCTDEKHIAIIMEYVEGRDLATVIQDRQLVLTPMQQLHIAEQIATGCNWLHRLSPTIIHRDLKPANILLTKEFKVKIGDFGLACVKEEWTKETHRRESAIGSPIWMAPEVLCGAQANEKSDVYAYGLVLWELWTRKERPYAHLKNFGEFCDEVIEQGKRPEIPPGSTEVGDFIQRCWHKDPSKRPSFEQILEELPKITTNVLISDPSGRSLWSSIQERGNSDLPFSCSWRSFEQALIKHLALDAVSPQDTRLRCLAEILAEHSHNLTASSPEVIVKCEVVGRFLDAFGPLDAKCLKRFEKLCRSGCFHGEIDSTTAIARLDGYPAGSFIIRLSSHENCLTVSKVASNKVTHQRMFKSAEQGYLISIDGVTKTYRTFSKLLKDNRETLQLLQPCTKGSRFAAIFEESEQGHGSVAYVSSSFINKLG